MTNTYGIHRVLDEQLHAGEVVVLEVGVDLADHVGVVRTILIKPEDGGGSGGAATLDS